MSSGERGRRKAAWALTGLVAAVAAGVFVWSLPDAVRFLPHAPSGFWAIAILGTLVDIPVYAYARRAGQPVRTTLSACFTFAIFLLWGAGPAIVVQALAGTVAAVTQRYTRSGGVFLTSRLVCALAAAEVAVVLSERRTLAPAGPFLTTDDVVGFVLPAGVWFAASFGLLFLARAANYGGGLRRAVSDLRGDVLATTAAMLLVSPLLTTLTGWWTALVAVPLFALSQLTWTFAQHEQRLRRDPVTGLLNRGGLIYNLESLTAADRLDPEHRRPLGMVLVNVESVLTVNRSLGRGLYERVVAAAAGRLAGEFGEDLVGRLSGEAFVVLIPGLTADGARAAGERAAAALEPTIVVDGIPFAADPAIGVALSPQHGRDFTTLASNAELAMGEARRTAARVEVYAASVQEVPQRRIALLSELRAALVEPARHHEIAVFYQPQVDLDTGALAGAEALVRWTHPEWGLVAPDELLEAVEPTEVMHLLTRHVLERAVSDIRAWRDRGLRVRVAVNASVRDLYAPKFIDEIRRLLAIYRVPSSDLTIEITERILIGDAERVRRVSDAIVGLGVGLSLDDFGTGYASLQQLQQLPLTEVKLDKSYVLGVTGTRAQRAIVTGVHELARALGLAIVAEGVEDAQIARQLAKLPGTIGQGWYFGRPVPADEFAEVAQRLQHHGRHERPWRPALVTGRTPRS